MIKVHSSIINRVKKGLVILAIIITVVFLLLFITAWVMESRVKNIVVNELNKTLITKVDVEDINLSLIRKFPYASLQFKNITVASAFNNDTNLLEANHLFLKFSIFDVIRGKYVTKKVDVENAKLYVKRNHQGKNNYDIWKSSGMNDTTDFYFDIKQVFLKNIAIVYLDEPTDFSFDVLIDKGTLQGAFSSMTYEMTLNGNLVINQIDIEGQKFFSGQQATTNINVLVDNYTYFYTINQSTLNIDGLSFSVKGIVNDADDAGIVDIKVISDNITLKEAIAILPQEYSHYLNQYDYYGSANMETHITGSYLGNSFPVIRSHFSMKDAVISHHESGIKLESINLSGEYISHKKGGNLYLREVNAKLGKGEIDGMLQIVDLLDPKIKIVAHSELLLHELNLFLPENIINDMEGRFTLNCMLEIQPGSNYNFSNLNKIKTNGDLTLQNVSIAPMEDSRRISHLNGKFIFNNNDLIAKELQWNVGASKFKLQGYFMNVVRWLFSQDNLLEIKANLSSPSLQLEDLFNDNSNTEKGESIPFSFPRNITANLKISADKFSYGKFYAEKLSGNVSLYNQKLYANHLYMKAMDGTLEATGLVEQLENFNFKAACNATFMDLDAKKLFYQFNNFGQTSLTNDHIKGKLHTKIAFKATLDKHLNILLPSIVSDAEIIIEEGALIHYKPVEYLAKYVRVNDLSHIQFSTLKNHIRIENEQIFIPEMMIKSDAGNFSISGIQYFDGRMQYHMQLLLTELISKKAKKANQHNSEFGRFNEDSKGQITLYLLIGGTIDEPEVKYDRKEARKNVKEQLQQEKQHLKTILNEEFGIFEKEKTEQEKKPVNEISIEWDDDD